MQRRQFISIPRNHVHDHFHIARVHVGENDFRIAFEDGGVERERRLRRVPTARREAGTEVDHRVDGNAFRAEGIDHAEQLRLVFDRAMGLHVAERPFRRHHRRSGDRRIVFHELRWLVAIEDEDVIETRDDLVDRRKSFSLTQSLIAFVLRNVVVCSWLPGNEPAAICISQVDLHPRRRDEHAHPFVPTSIATGLRDP